MNALKDALVSQYIQALRASSRHMTLDKDGWDKVLCVLLQKKKKREKLQTGYLSRALNVEAKG